MIKKDQVIDPEEMHFLRKIKKELQLDDEYEVIPFVASVLQALRQTLSLKNANALLNSLPDFLKLVFVVNWRQNEDRIFITHLDEFVNLVIARDQHDKKFLFKSELQTLSVIILTLKKLSKLIDLERFEGLSPTFRHELLEASTEVTVY